MEPLVHQVCLAVQDLLVQVVDREQVVPQVNQVLQEHQEHQEHRVLQV